MLCDGTDLHNMRARPIMFLRFLPVVGGGGSGGCVALVVKRSK